MWLSLSNVMCNVIPCFQDCSSTSEACEDGHIVVDTEAEASVCMCVFVCVCVDSDLAHISHASPQSSVAARALALLRSEVSKVFCRSTGHLSTSVCLINNALHSFLCFSCHGELVFQLILIQCSRLTECDLILLLIKP
ncbi:hypothetical protein AMECASPLE_016334 [Ameca splendens]|uniref:Uncharacterized protein n=1 Tax=Ameca splendens TaxID=208324 RepID=A0ABV0Z1A8_9TELE